MKTSPLVSVIIPVYNDYEYLLKCLSSIQKQTHNNIEIIVVDDGSDPNKKADLTTHNLKIYAIDHHGAAYARNEGFTHARGKYVIFLDADEKLMPECLESMVNILEADPEYAFVYSQFFNETSNGELWLFRSNPFSLEMFRMSNYIAISSLMRKNCFMGFDEDLNRWQDWDMWWRMARHGHKGYFIDKPLFLHTYYRADSLSQKEKPEIAGQVMNYKRKKNLGIKCHIERRYLMDQKTIEEVKCVYEQCPFAYWDDDIEDFLVKAAKCPCRETYLIGAEEVVVCKIQGTKGDRIS